MYDDILECLQEADKTATMIDALYQKMGADPTNPMWEKTMPNGLNFRRCLRQAWLLAIDVPLNLNEAKQVLEYEEP